MWLWDYLPDAQTVLKGKQAAIKAVEIDESLGAAHSSLAHSRLVSDWDWKGAHSSFNRAIELSPGDLYCHTGYGGYFMAVGEMAQAIAQGRLAREIDPLSPQAHTYLGMFYARAGLTGNAVSEFRQAIEIQSDQPQAHWLLGQTLILESCYQEGLHEIENAFELSGHTPEARGILETLQRRSKDEYIRPYLIAKVHCAVGEVDEAFRWLTKALEERDRKLAYVKTDETLAALHSDSRFEELLKNMGLPGELA
jgi:tetratricopeptide (TPR) repeat protein